MKLPIMYYGNPVLRKNCAHVDEITDEIRTLVVDMIETFDHLNGIGIAAPQVGRSISLFVLRHYIISDKKDAAWDVTEPFVYINPKILEYSEETWIEEEGCLSIPGLRLPVKRPLRVKVEATDLKGNRFIQELEGYNARSVMHENDHIHGVLYIDRVEERFKKPVEGLLRDLKKQQGIP